MKKIFDQRFFRLLSECSQRKVSASEFAEAIEELATHVADFSIQNKIIAFYSAISLLVCIVLNHTVYGLSRKKNILFVSN